MKTFAIILILGFSWQLSNASKHPLETCFVENGFNTSSDNLELIQRIGDPESVDVLNAVPKENMAGLAVCLFHKYYTDKDIYTSLKDLIIMNDNITDDEARRMNNTLNDCKEKAAGDDKKLLICVKAFEPPFNYLLSIARDYPNTLTPCSNQCGMTIGDLQTILSNEKNISEILKHVLKEKLYCDLACKFDLMMDGKEPLQESIKSSIVRASQFSEDTKKEMIKTVDKCQAEVAAAEQPNPKYELIKCIKLLDNPFVDMFKGYPA